MYLGSSPRAVMNKRNAIASAANMALDCLTLQPEFCAPLRELHAQHVADRENDRNAEDKSGVHGSTLCYVNKDNPPTGHEHD